MLLICIYYEAGREAGNSGKGTQMCAAVGGPEVHEGGLI